MLEGHIPPQELVLLIVVVEDVEPRRLVVLGVDDEDVLARRLALMDDCRVEDYEMLDGRDARLDVECSMSVYLSRRRCHRSVDSSGSVLRRKKWNDAGSSSRRGSRPFLHHFLACESRTCR